jgi:hypothetical protein
MKQLIIIAALLCASVHGEQPADIGLQHLDPVYVTGSCGSTAIGPRQYEIRWPASVKVWYGQLQFRDSDTSGWVDCWNIHLDENCWKYDSSRVVVCDRYNYIKPTWQYRVILW